MYILLKGAIKNVGDFLIADRGKELLRRHKAETDFLEFGRWEPLDNMLDEINQCRAIILCGGPGYAPDFYPGIFALAKNLNDIKVPIIPYGLGWNGQPMFHPEQFYFSNDSMNAIKEIHSRCQWTSCRDNITRGILSRCGFNNVSMTGCPSWFVPDFIGRRFERPQHIQRLVVSMVPFFPHAAPYSALVHQNIELLTEIRILCERLQIRPNLFATFHRGIESDKFTGETEAEGLRILKQSSMELGYEVRDVSYDTSKINFYSECDLHIGYRVHAHIFFLSLRKPSFLLHVDGRGRALSQTLGLPDVSALTDTMNSSVGKRVSRALETRLHYAISRIRSKPHSPELNRHAIRSIVGNIGTEFENGFRRFQGLDSIIDSHYEKMVNFLGTLP